MPAGFRYPLEPHPALAVYEGSETFDPQAAGAETVALPGHMLRTALLSGWQPMFGVVVFTGPGYGVLTDADRDRIWNRWGVPVYEHRVDSAGQIIAEECDAHDGLHLRQHIDWEGEIVTTSCSCGLQTARIPATHVATIVAAA